MCIVGALQENCRCIAVALKVHCRHIAGVFDPIESYLNLFKLRGFTMHSLANARHHRTEK